MHPVTSYVLIVLTVGFGIAWYRERLRFWVDETVLWLEEYGVALETFLAGMQAVAATGITIGEFQKAIVSLQEPEPDKPRAPSPYDRDYGRCMYSDPGPEVWWIVMTPAILGTVAAILLSLIIYFWK